MSRRKPAAPTLADALAKGFENLKSDDSNPPSVEELSEEPEQQEPVVESEPLSKPQYGRPAQHVGQQSSFVVNAKKSEGESSDEDEVTEKVVSKHIEILDKPSTSIGDDFDVEW
ncbi:MAG: hypothetical protein HOL22_02790 [Euryarchaeota archaeon]|jgi:hypothetical protein|nr:hypothetical protein [Euryarchaeota archaeon]MBT5594685.1 hypothetical protein [Euryarchaeota archaeon]MBT5844398.1 hypothetical protein [Euryarchaeota archaeon]MBT6639976.1 hypothetical protein [Euryarchaeota archaeon]MBT6844211.1 hypothetical protein [Euryarchaeota archaeon]